MDEKKTGSLILKSVTPGSEASVEAFLAGLFKKAPAEKIRSSVRNAPTVLTRSVTAQQAGPVIDRLTQLGAVAEFEPAEPASQPVEPQPRASTVEAPGPHSTAIHACSQCGRSYPEDEMLFFEDMWVCAACKTDFVQKLKEGQRVKGQLTYGGFWLRGGAKIVDGIIFLSIGFVVTFLVNMTGGITASGNPAVSALITNLLKVLLSALYSTWFVGRYAATPGKMACGLRIVMPDGDRVSYARALGRHFAEWISSMIFGIGYLMAAFDGEKRTLHDRICGTRVVKK